MNRFKIKIKDTLLKLKTECAVSGLKAEFEAEGAIKEEVLFLKELADETGLMLSVKISGPQAMRDIYDLREISPNAVISPMIESPYAAFLFVESIKKVFGENFMPKLFIGVETKFGFKYLDEILSSPFSKMIYGVVVGRSDLVRSINFSGDKKVSVDSDIILNYALNAGRAAKKYGKKLITGGLVTENSIPFFKSLMANDDITFSGFETRKVVFDSNALLKNNVKEGILLALEFEILWLKMRIESGFGTNEDKKRLDDIQNRYYYKI